MICIVYDFLDAGYLSVDANVVSRRRCRRRRRHQRRRRRQLLNARRVAIATLQMRTNPTIKTSASTRFLFSLELNDRRTTW